MAQIVASDLVDYNEVKFGSDGFEASRGFQITGLSGNPDQRAFEAISLPGLPLIGELHPTINSIEAYEVSFETQGAETGVVVVRYKAVNPTDKSESSADETQPPVISIGSTVQETVTNVDVKGKTMELNHTRRRIVKKEDGTTEPKDEKMKTAPVNASKQVPHTTITFTRKERSSPFAKSEIFVGTINSRTFFGLPKHLWLCTGIDGNSDDGGRSYLVTYNFQRAEKLNTWDPVFTYTDDATGLEVTGLNIKNKKGPLTPDDVGADEQNLIGKKRFQLYPESDFNELNLDFGQASDSDTPVGLVINRPGFSRPTFPALKKGQ